MPRRLPRHFGENDPQTVQRLADAVREDFGDEFDVDWQKLDPRQYDPRRIVREALAEEDGQQTQKETPAQTAVGVSPVERYMEQAKKRDRTKPAPFDTEAT